MKSLLIALLALAFASPAWCETWSGHEIVAGKAPVTLTLTQTDTALEYTDAVNARGCRALTGSFIDGSAADVIVAECSDDEVTTSCQTVATLTADSTTTVYPISRQWIRVFKTAVPSGATDALLSLGCSATASAGGSGDITDVGDCASGACLPNLTDSTTGVGTVDLPEPSGATGTIAYVEELQAASGVMAYATASANLVTTPSNVTCSAAEVGRKVAYYATDAMFFVCVNSTGPVWAPLTSMQTVEVSVAAADLDDGCAYVETNQQDINSCGVAAQMPRIVRSLTGPAIPGQGACCIVNTSGVGAASDFEIDLMVSTTPGTIPYTVQQSLELDLTTATCINLDWTRTVYGSATVPVAITIGIDEVGTDGNNEDVDFTCTIPFYTGAGLGF